MTEKELSKYYWLKIEIKDLEDRIEELGNGVGSIKIKEDVTSSQHTNTSIQERIALLRDNWIEKRVEALEECMKIKEYIDSVDDPEIRVIMRMRFIDFKNWEKIGDELHSDRTTVSKKMRKYIRDNTLSHISHSNMR